MSDTPHVDLVLSNLEREVVKPEPFVVVLSKNKRITFQDPLSFRVSERKEVLALYEKAQTGQADDMDFFQKILSDSDYQKYVAEDLPIRVHHALAAKVMAHFEGSLGSAGEGDGSGS